MSREQQDTLESIRQLAKSYSNELLDYWNNFSNANTWQFWLCVALIGASLLPVSCMLVYQSTVNHKKNRYLYFTLLGVFYSFIFKPIMSRLDFFKLYEWMNFAYLFIVYLIVMLISIWITAFFLHLQKSVTAQRQ
jgi:hypothetical protein